MLVLFLAAQKTERRQQASFHQGSVRLAVEADPGRVAQQLRKRSFDQFTGRLLRYDTDVLPLVLHSYQLELHHTVRKLQQLIKPSRVGDKDRADLCLKRFVMRPANFRSR